MSRQGRGGTCYTRDSLVHHFTSLRSKILKAKHVVIVGGGARGVELAAEIVHQANSKGGKKRVTLLHRGVRRSGGTSERRQTGRRER